MQYIPPRGQMWQNSQQRQRQVTNISQNNGLHNIDSVIKADRCWWSLLWTKKCVSFKKSFSSYIFSHLRLIRATRQQWPKNNPAEIFFFINSLETHPSDEFPAFFRSRCLLCSFLLAPLPSIPLYYVYLSFTFYFFLFLFFILLVASHSCNIFCFFSWC